MTPPDGLIRIQHLREAAEKALDFTRRKSGKDFEDDEVLRLAITKLVEIMGEAAKQVSQPTRLAHLTVP